MFLSFQSTANLENLSKTIAKLQNTVDDLKSNVDNDKDKNYNQKQEQVKSKIKESNVTLSGTKQVFNMTPF